MARNQGRMANMVYGICTNTSGKEDGTPCSKCQNKEIQAIRASKEFVCEECHEPLRKVDRKKGPNVKLIIIIAVAVVVVGGAVAAVLLTGGKKADKPITTVTDTTTDTTTDKTDAVFIDTTITVEQVADKNVVKDPVTPKPSPKPATVTSTRTSETDGDYDLGWGIYNGRKVGGKPDGAGGMISVKSSYSITLNDVAGSTLQVNPGDKIVNTKFVNGTLRQGELQRTDGSRKWFNR